MVIAWDMSSFPRFIRVVYRAPKSDTIVLLSTFILTVVQDLTFAVEVGMIMAVFLFLKRMIEVTGIRPSERIASSELVFGAPEDSPGAARSGS
jgi:SulP family sulfate permease